jgi:NADPH:quinone reductase
VRKRQDAFDYGMPYPRSSRTVMAREGDEVGEGVAPEWLGEPVWCYGAQTYRPFGTTAEFTVIRVDQLARLPNGVSMEQGACLGIPGITAHHAVHVAGPVHGKTVLVQGAAGAVGLCVVQLARRAGARVIGVVRSSSDEATAIQAGAHEVVRAGPELVPQVMSLAPDGIDHVIEVAFDDNIRLDVELLKLGGSIATYAAGHETPVIPFRPLVFQNTRVSFLGSDDFPKKAKMDAAQDLTAALEAGWSGFEIAERLTLEQIARAHEWIEQPVGRGRIVIKM